jgi:hypothetical protein
MPNKTKYRNRKNIKKSTRRKCNNKRKTKRRNRGGRYINSGTYGHVYGEPRLLCDKEDLSILDDKHSAPYKEVSKIFSRKTHADIELNSVKHLKSIMSEKDLRELHDYCVLPIRKCIVKENIARNPPYNTENWRKNTNQQYNPIMLNRDSGLYGFQDMITYRQGGDDLFNKFNKIRNIDGCINCLYNLFSILKGIQMLQKYNIIHGDLKSPNCIEIDDTFKIIDMADVKKIITSNDSNNLPDAFGYYTWPSISVYTLFFDDIKMKEYQVNPEQKFKINRELLQQLYHTQTHFNNMNYYQNVNTHLRDCFRDIDIEFSADDLQKIRNIGNDLIAQKTFGIIDSIENKYDAEEDKTKIINSINGRDTSKSDSLNAFLDKFNTIFSSFDSEEEMKLDLFKRIDIYSFGIMVLYVIKKFIVCLSKKKELIIQDRLDYIYDLYHFVNVCCYQYEKVVSIDDLVFAYDAILDYISNVEYNDEDEEDEEDEVNNTNKANNILTVFGELPFHE